MTDEEIEVVARGICTALGLDPDESVGCGWFNDETPAERLQRYSEPGGNEVPGSMPIMPRWRLYRWKAAEALATQAALKGRHNPMTDETGWRPIETAPKDFTPILAFIPGNGEDWDDIAVVFWKANGFRYQHDDHIGCEPTHWQPLPPPPTPKEKA